MVTLKRKRALEITLNPFLYSRKAKLYLSYDVFITKELLIMGSVGTYVAI